MLSDHTYPTTILFHQEKNRQFRDLVINALMSQINVDVYLLQQIYDELANVIGDQQISPANLMRITALAMTVVERQTNMDGEAKKAMVIALLHRLVDAVDKREITDENREILHAVIDATVPAAIDVLIDATKGGLDINKIKSKWSSLKCC